MPPHEIRILLADDHPALRKGLIVAIADFNIATEIIAAENGPHTLELAAQHTIDLFMLDFRMPGMDGHELTRRLLATDRTRKIIVFSMFTDRAIIENVYLAGAKAFIDKNAELSEIEEAIRTVLRGEVFYSKYAREMMEQGGYGNFTITFSDHEHQLVKLLSVGKRSYEIANAMGLTPKTIETYRSRLLEKTRTRNTAELMGYFFRNGLMQN